MIFAKEHFLKTPFFYRTSFIYRRLLTIGIVLFSLSLSASELDPMLDVYEELSNIYAPSESDFIYLQKKLSTVHRPIIDRMKDTAFIGKNFRLIDIKGKNKQPKFGHFYINSKEDERENCIVLYASFNRNYPKGVKRLVNIIQQSDFCGHLYYRIGGWPNIEEGDLTLAHVPFAFKVCFFREMKRLGYKRVLWVDSSILPWVSLNTIFNLIQERGFFVQANSHDVGLFMNREACKHFDVSLEECHNILSCSAAIVGIDFTNPKTAPIIDAWYAAAKDPDAFFSARSDQNALSIILYKLGLIDLMWPATTLGEPNNTNKDTLFLMNREYVKNIND